jgi:tetratricopeptide (TPR) repeat protein
VHDRIRSLFAVAYAVMLVVALPTAVVAEESTCTEAVAVVTSAQGDVAVRSTGHGDWSPAALNQALCPGDEIRTGRYGRAQIRLFHPQGSQNGRDGTLLQLAAQSAMMLPQADRPWWVELLDGAAHVLSRTPRDFTIKTRFANARVEGTEFLVRMDDRQTEVSVFEGRVRVSNAAGDLQLAHGETAIADAKGPPRREIRLRPRDAVQWTLYYPPILDGRAARARPSLVPAWDQYRHGRIALALQTLDALPQSEHDAAFHGIRAALLLSVGQVDAASADIDAANEMRHNDATALALSAIIALAQNDRARAHTLADQAVVAEPDASVGYVARSYVEQASQALPAALSAARRAAELDDTNALSWARVAELQLAVDDLRQAETSAAHAIELDPRVARTHTVSGFIALARQDIARAHQAFSQAIILDPADPLPRLGVGLAKIRDGRLAEGRRDIEDAANLDPDDALVRSYLGKAYYEERRSDVAATELANAKALDPLDPTPWFYDGIRKQTENRPVEALHDLQRAATLNGNRGVYRSSLALDSDLAARSATQGRVYRDLGFERLGLIQGWRSLLRDPTDHSAHRLLADAYRTTLRNDIGRASELLQAQLFQPLNMLPVQPDATEESAISSSALRDGSPVLSDFNSLFQRSGFGLNVAAAVGSQDRFSDQVIHTGLWRQFSYSLGQSHFQSDGYRTNNDLRLDTYNAFAQAQLSPAFSVQAEYRRRETETGFLPQFADPTFADFFKSFRTETQIDSVRLGARFNPTPRSSFIVSGLSNDGEAIDTEPGFFTDREIDGYSAEARFDHRGDWLQWVVGGGHYRIDTDFGGTLCEPFPSPCFSVGERHDNGYLYATAHWPMNFAWTLGASHDDYGSPGQLKANRWNPKLGAVWSITPRTDLRIAYLETVRRSLFANQTIEPSIVAGFDQFFDDPTASEAIRRGIGIDHSFTDDLHGGVELSSRLLRVPVAETDLILKWKETSTVAYLTWTPLTSVAASVEYRREDFRNTAPFGPPATDNRFVPVAVAYFHPGGFFAKVRGQYISQDVDPNGLDESDNGYFVDLSVGYRLKKQRGILELSFENLLDTDMRYEGDFNRGKADPLSIPRALPFSPDFGVIATMRLAL